MERQPSIATSYDPLVGYDPALAGAKPYPLENPATLLDYLKTYISPTTGWLVGCYGLRIGGNCHVHGDED